MLSSNEMVVSEAGSNKLELLMSSRNLNKSQTAKILGVEPWTVGAWLSGKREISSKYKEKINEYLDLPQTSDLLISPAVNQLAKQINQAEDEADVVKVTDALTKIITSASYKLVYFSIQSIDVKLMAALKKMLEVYDDCSIAKVNQTISNILADRMLDTSFSPEEYAYQCIERTEKDALNKELILELSSGILSAHYSLTFNINDELYKRYDDIKEEFGSKHFNFEHGYYESLFNEETGECLLDDEEINTALIPIKEKHEVDTRECALMIFQFTDFEEDERNSMWTDNNTYSVTYKISLDDPKFKDSLRMVMNRQTVSDNDYILLK